MAAKPNHYLHDPDGPDLTVQDLMVFLGCGMTTAYKLVREGHIDGVYELNGRANRAAIRIPRQSAHDFKKQRQAAYRRRVEARQARIEERGAA